MSWLDSGWVVPLCGDLVNLCSRILGPHQSAISTIHSGHGINDATKKHLTLRPKSSTFVSVIPKIFFSLCSQSTLGAVRPKSGFCLFISPLRPDCFAALRLSHDEPLCCGNRFLFSPVPQVLLSLDEIHLKDEWDLGKEMRCRYNDGLLLLLEISVGGQSTEQIYLTYLKNGQMSGVTVLNRTK